MYPGNQKFKMGPRGLALLKKWEGFEEEAYLDTGGVLTIAYGHTSMAGPPKVTKGMKVTRERGEEILRADLTKFEGYVKQLVNVPLTQAQFDALTSFCYNVGPDIDEDKKAEGLGDSTLLKKLNKQDYKGAQAEFGKWVNDGNKRLGGLVNRRADEAKLFMEDGLPTGAEVPLRRPVPRTDSGPKLTPDKAPVNAPAVLTKDQVKQMQELLKRAGYVEVGRIDGIFGDDTLGAMQKYQRDFGIPVSDGPNKETLARLAVQEPNSRPIARERQTANTADVVEDAPEVMQPTLNTKWWAKLQTWGSTFLSLISGGMFAGWGERVLGLPPYVLLTIWFTFLALMISGGLFWFMTWRAQRQIVNAYQERKVV